MVLCVMMLLYMVGGRIQKRDIYERGKSLKSESVMMFSAPLMFWGYMDTSLMMSVHPSHQANVLWGSSLNGSNEAL